MGDDEGLLRCARRHPPIVDWIHDDGCEVELIASRLRCWRATEARHVSTWRCVRCGHVVQRPSPLAQRLDEICWPID